MAEPFDAAKDVVSRQRLAIIESTSVPGQPGHVVLNPDGSNVSGGGGGGGTVDQGTGGISPWVIRIDQTGVNNDVDAHVTNGAGAAAVNIQDGGNSITVDGTVTTTPVGTQDVNLIQVAGNAVNTGNGIAASGTQRVAIASDNSPLTVDQGTGGISPWSIKIDQTGVNNDVDANVTNGPGAAAVNIQDGGNSITVDGTVTATPSGTQDINLIQVAGNPVATGNGIATTGTQRVAIASDNTPFSVNANQAGTWTNRIQDSGGNAINNGQQTMANSVPVVIASNQTSIPVTTTLVTGFPISNVISVAAGPTATPLAGAPTPVRTCSIVTRLSNAADLFMGGVTVNAGNGLRLEAGRGLTIENVDLANVYIDGNAGDGVSFMAIL